MDEQKELENVARTDRSLWKKVSPDTPRPADY